jgi:predicted Fe-Mo cluster-binding NifX family protein
MEVRMNLMVAFGTDDGKNLNTDHVGNAHFFLIYRFLDGREKSIEKKRNPKFQEDESLIHGDPAKAAAVGSVLQGVDVLVGKKFGPNIVRLKKKFVCVIVRADSIEDATEIVGANIDVIEAEKNKGEARSHLVLKK